MADKLPRPLVAQPMEEQLSDQEMQFLRELNEGWKDRVKEFQEEISKIWKLEEGETLGLRLPKKESLEQLGKLWMWINNSSEEISSLLESLEELFEIQNKEAMELLNYIKSLDVWAAEGKQIIDDMLLRLTERGIMCVERARSHGMLNEELKDSLKMIVELKRQAEAKCSFWGKLEDGKAIEMRQNIERLEKIVSDLASVEGLKTCMKSIRLEGERISKIINTARLEITSQFLSVPVQKIFELEQQMVQFEKRYREIIQRLDASVKEVKHLIERGYVNEVVGQQAVRLSGIAEQLVNKGTTQEEELKQMQMQLRLWAVCRLEEDLKKITIPSLGSGRDSPPPDGVEDKPVKSLPLGSIEAELVELQRQVEMLEGKEVDTAPQPESSDTIEAVTARRMMVRKRISGAKERVRSLVSPETLIEMEGRLGAGLVEKSRTLCLVIDTFERGLNFPQID
jgi:hypothetical protein